MELMKRDIRGFCLFLFLVFVSIDRAFGVVIYEFTGNCNLRCTGEATAVITLSDSYVPGTEPTREHFISFSYSSSYYDFSYDTLEGPNGGQVIRGIFPSTTSSTAEIFVNFPGGGTYFGTEPDPEGRWYSDGPGSYWDGGDTYTVTLRSQSKTESSSPVHNVRISSFTISNFQDSSGFSQTTSIGFDINAPTFVVTHGWQTSGDYQDSSWDFSTVYRLEKLNLTLEALEERLLAEEVDSGGTPLKANVILVEWEGAYTGGSLAEAVLESEVVYQSSSLARSNADYAGLILGKALADHFGSSYGKDIHFIGHSFGTIVNGLATKYLSDSGWFDGKEQVVQFTALDAPTNRDLFARNFDDDWFSTNLAEEVDYVDNYYGEGLFAFGESYIGNFNQLVGYSHSDIWDGFYNSLVLQGQDVNTEGTPRLFDD